MLKKIYEFIDDYVRDNIIFKAIVFLLCGTIVAGYCFFSVVDRTPATEADYKPLIQQREAISKNFNTIYTYDNYAVSPDEDNIKIVLDNKQCKLTCIYDKDFTFISEERTDLCESTTSAFFLSLLIGFYIGGIAMILLTMVLPFVLSYLFKFIEWLCLLLIGRR